MCHRQSYCPPHLRSNPGEQSTIAPVMTTPLTCVCRASLIYIYIHICIYVDIYTYIHIYTLESFESGRDCLMCAIFPQERHRGDYPTHLRVSLEGFESGLDCLICAIGNHIADGITSAIILCFFFFLTLVTGPRRSLSLKLSDTRVYEPQIYIVPSTVAPRGWLPEKAR